VCIAHYGALLSGCGQARGWPGLLIFYLLPCAAHPTCPCPNCPELSPGRMGWSWNRQNHPERPLWPREIASPCPHHRQPVEAHLSSQSRAERGERDKVAPLGKGVKPPCRAGYYRELDAREALFRWAAKPPVSNCQLWQFAAILDRPQITPCRGLRGRSAGMPENQRRRPLGKRVGFPPAYGSTVRGRKRLTRCFLLLCYYRL
jgi:hypothetical protein